MMRYTDKFSEITTRSKTNPNVAMIYRKVKDPATDNDVTSLSIELHQNKNHKQPIAIFLNGDEEDGMPPCAIISRSFDQVGVAIQKEAFLAALTFYQVNANDMKIMGTNEKLNQKALLVLESLKA